MYWLQRNVALPAAVGSKIYREWAHFVPFWSVAVAVCSFGRDLCQVRARMLGVAAGWLCCFIGNRGRCLVWGHGYQCKACYEIYPRSMFKLMNSGVMQIPRVLACWQKLSCRPVHICACLICELVQLMLRFVFYAGLIKLSISIIAVKLVSYIAAGACSSSYMSSFAEKQLLVCR